MPYEYFTNNAVSTVAVAVSDSATEVQPTDPSTFPAQSRFRIRIGSELMMVTAVMVIDGTLTKWQVDRGIEGTTAAAHNPGSSIRAVVTAEALDALNAIPAGGAAGQFLTKAGTDDFDTQWSNDASGLTDLNASNITSGTIDDARLSSNVPLKDVINTFTNQVQIFQTSSSTAGLLLQPVESDMNAPLLEMRAITGGPTVQLSTYGDGALMRMGYSGLYTGPSRIDFHAGIFGASSAIIIWHADVSTFQFLSSGKSYMNGGNVGFGLTSPDASLHAKSYSSSEVASIFQGVASQSANLTEWKNDAGTVLASVASNGAITPASMSDSAASNNTLYYSTTANKLAFKDGSGVVNVLY